MKFPRDLLRFLYWIYFKPLSLSARINRIHPALENTPALLTRSDQPLERSFKSLALFHILVTPWLLGFGTGLVLSWLGMDVNRVMLAFYLFIVIVLSLTFQVVFCTAFLLPFSIMVAIWSSTPFNLALGGLFSLALGFAYGLTGHTARWGLIASLVYGVLFSILLMLLMINVGTWVGLALCAPPDAPGPPARQTGALALNLGLLLLAWSGVAMALGAACRRGVASATAALLAFAALLVEHFQQFWAPLQWAAVLSPFHYFTPFPLVMGRPLAVENLVVLWGMAMTGFTLAYFLLSQRDISR